MASSAAVSALAVTAVLPRCGWAALQAWAPQGRTVFGVMPLDAHALDFASGAFSSGVVLLYLMAVFTVLFINSKAVSARRLAGRGGLPLKCSGHVGGGFTVAHQINGGTFFHFHLSPAITRFVNIPYKACKIKFKF